MKKITSFVLIALLNALCFLPAQALDVSNNNDNSMATVDSNRYSVLAYHSIIDGSEEATIDGKYLPQTIRLETLVNQFNWLLSSGYRPISYQDVIDARMGKKNLPPKAILLTFDDGYQDFYRVVFPLLKLYKFPAVLAIVGKWIDVPTGENVSYGGTTKVPRNLFLSWAQIKELSDSGLVEIASHSYDLHHSEQANSLGSMQPAVFTPIWANGVYETEASFKERITNDLKKSATEIKQYTGIAPRIIVWPYGRFSDFSTQAANSAGLTEQLLLDEGGLNKVDERQVTRLLMEEETEYGAIEEPFKHEDWDNKVQRVVHVDLDYVYDKDLVQQGKNLDKLIDRIKAYGVSTVYLQAYSDVNGDGVAESLYFPNRHMPVRSDLFGRVSWQLMSRAGVKVYAWMPVLAFDMGAGHEYVKDVRTGAINPTYYKRLSPFNADNRKAVKEIYSDLGLYSRFNGVLFHDDAFLTDYEGISAEELPSVVANDGDKLDAFATRKTQMLIDFTKELADQAAYNQTGGRKQLKTARNIYAETIVNPTSRRWFAQDLKSFVKNYDYTAVMAMPYMEKSPQPKQWLEKLAKNVASQVDPSNVVFELQAKDWQTKKDIPTSELVEWMGIIKNNGIRNYGYYPDDFINNRPDAKQMHSSLSLATQGTMAP